MAKRKTARAGRNKAGGGRKTAGRTRPKAKKAAPRRAAKAARKTAASRKAVRKAVRKSVRKAVRKAAAPRTRATARKTIKRAAPKAAPRKATRKPAAPVARKRTAAKPKTTVPVRKAPSLNRARRVIDDDDIVQSTPPSSLDLDRSASSARSGRRTLLDKYAEHTETGPALTGGDIDADWESAYSVGDEAPGGDNPTPDQDIVDDIGRAVGVEYQDNEELKGADKVAKRDKNRWELDPASSDDWEDR